MRPRSLAEVRRHLESHAKPLHSVPVDKLTRQDVADLLTAIASASGPVAANRARSSISTLLNWAMREGKVTENAAAFTNKRDERERERVLSADELAAIWDALSGDSDYADILKLLILTGQRKSEIGDLRWSEINLEKGTITLPPARLKNGNRDGAKPHVVPMSGPVKAIIAAIPREPGRDFVFGYGAGGFSGWSPCKERLDARLPNLPQWTIHDLRRTCATMLAEFPDDGGLGVPPHVVEAVLNHVGHKAGVAGIYNRSSYQSEMRDALTRWADHVLEIVGEGAKRRQPGRAS